MPKTAWWKGTHGEWWVVLQIALFGLLIFGPRNWDGAPAWPDFFRHAAIGGWVLVLAGGTLFVAGILRLGTNLTPVPYPKEQGRLIQTGPYAIVRHPIYSGGCLAAFGWAWLAQGWLTLGYALILFAFFDLKSRREERWLCERYPDYPAYRKRVRKLIPFIY